MHITIIAYRPNGADYCRGSCQGTSSSDMEIEHFDTADDTDDYDAVGAAAKDVSHYQVQDKIDETSREISEYEITILINGKENTDWFEHDNLVWDMTEKILKLAEPITKEKIKIHNGLKEIKQAEKTQKIADEQRARDLKQYEKLKKTFE